MDAQACGAVRVRERVPIALNRAERNSPPWKVRPRARWELSLVGLTNT
jgi:hypothetical protein